MNDKQTNEEWRYEGSEEQRAAQEWAARETRRLNPEYIDTSNLDFRQRWLVERRLGQSEMKG